MILFGGDGAAALLGKLGITEMRILYAIVPGVPFCIVDDGAYSGMKVMTKSGGFGNLNLLNEMMEM